MWNINFLFISPRYREVEASRSDTLCDIKRVIHAFAWVVISLCVGVVKRWIPGFRLSPPRIDSVLIKCEHANEIQIRFRLYLNRLDSSKKRAQRRCRFARIRSTTIAITLPLGKRQCLSRIGIERRSTRREHLRKETNERNTRAAPCRYTVYALKNQRKKKRKRTKRPNERGDYHCQKIK